MNPCAGVMGIDAQVGQILQGWVWLKTTTFCTFLVQSQQAGQGQYILAAHCQGGQAVGTGWAINDLKTHLRDTGIGKSSYFFPDRLIFLSSIGRSAYSLDRQMCLSLTVQADLPMLDRQICLSGMFLSLYKVYIGQDVSTVEMHQFYALTPSFPFLL